MYLLYNCTLMINIDYDVLLTPFYHLLVDTFVKNKFLRHKYLRLDFLFGCVQSTCGKCLLLIDDQI